MSVVSRQAGVAVSLLVAAGVGVVVWRAIPASVEPVRPGPAVLLEPGAPPGPVIGQPGKDVVWLPTSSSLVETMLDLADVTADDYLIDLGSGDGRTVIAAAKRGATALGVEYDPALVELSRQNAVTAGLEDRATFVEADLFETDLSGATVITMYLLPDLNLKLRPALLELEPGTRIVSNSFNMGEWQVDAYETIEETACRNWCSALLWIVPARVEGTWALPAGTLVLRQHYQFVEGTLAGRPLEGARLQGDQLRFTAGRTAYEARVDGNVMTGTDGPSSRWTARRSEP